ncbi:MAG TPA: hypothetical protein VHJ17_24950 [Thermomonospora sp.]|nr:hypothetical protein [Thermomonospora sp.]
MTASVFAVGGFVLSGCGTESVAEKSFTDEHGRVCTYIVVNERYGKKDVGNISCEYPSSPASSASASPSPR